MYPATTREWSSTTVVSHGQHGEIEFADDRVDAAIGWRWRILPSQRRSSAPMNRLDREARFDERQPLD